MAEATKKDKNIEVKVKGVIASFMEVWTPQEQKNDAGEITGYSYKCNYLISKSTEAGKKLILDIKDAMRQARDARWPPQDGVPKKFKADRMCLRDGDEEDWEGYAGHMYLSGNRKVKGPTTPNPMALIGPRKVKDPATGEVKFPRLKESDGLLYSGCKVNSVVRIYGYDGKGKFPDRINCSIEGIQFVEHGTPFGAKPINAEAAFDDEGPEGEDAFDGPGGKPAAGDDDLL